MSGRSGKARSQRGANEFRRQTRSQGGGGVLGIDLDEVSLCFFVFLCVSLCFFVFLCVSLCFFVFLCVTLFTNESLDVESFQCEDKEKIQ
jgi:hypothetical protein